LRNNPLGQVPDIGRMPSLQFLLLDGTGLDTWPVGLFSQSRHRAFYLDLRFNPISRIPEIAPGSFRAELLARTVISREPEWISPENLETLKSYIESVGMDPERPYPPQGLLGSSDWDTGIPEEQLPEKLATWDDLENEFESQWFFSELGKLTQSKDFTESEAYRADLTTKVWRMVEAMAADSDLRITLFGQAQLPTLCSDGATQLFNAMGVLVMEKEAYALVRPDLIEAELLKLAQGKSRLDELGAIGRQRVRDRLAAGEHYRRVNAQGDVTGTIDVVEVHLAYMTDLAERMDLPWQARNMLFREGTMVTQEHLDAAFNKVVTQEKDGLLVDRLLEQPIWKNWLEATYLDEMNSARRKVDAVTDLYDALQRRAEGTQMTAPEKARTEAEIKALCRELGKPENHYADGRNMLAGEYDELLIQTVEQLKQQQKTLTQQAMARAEIRPLRAPLTR
jgi:hypothetical protein